MNELDKLSNNVLATHPERTALCQVRRTRYCAKYDSCLSFLLPFALLSSLTRNALPLDFHMAGSQKSTRSHPKYHDLRGVLPDDPI